MMAMALETQQAQVKGKQDVIYVELLGGKRFGHALFQARDSQKLQQRELAKMIGCDMKLIGHVERGQRRAVTEENFAYLCEAAKLLNIEPPKRGRRNKSSTIAAGSRAGRKLGSKNSSKQLTLDLPTPKPVVAAVPAPEPKPKPTLKEALEPPQTVKEAQSRESKFKSALQLYNDGLLTADELLAITKRIN